MSERVRIYLGPEDNEADILRKLLGLADDPRSINWVGEERAVDVPEDVADRFADEARLVAVDGEPETTEPPKKRRGRPPKKAAEAADANTQE